MRSHMYSPQKTNKTLISTDLFRLRPWTWHARDPDPFGSQGIFHVEILHEMPRRQQEAAAMDQDDEGFLS